MPTYQYACTACGEQHEAVQAFTDAPLTECPACGGRLRKVFSAVGVVFKGSGFYKTDSRSGAKGSGEGAAAKSDTGAAAKSDSGGTSQSSTSKSDSGSSSGGSSGASTGSGSSGSGSSGSGSSSGSSGTPAAKTA